MKLHPVVLFIILCFSWGSTFLPLKLALLDLPPFLLAAFRFLLAGLVLSIWARKDTVKRKDLLAISLAGLPVITGNYGFVFWGAQFLPSGLTGVLSFASVALIFPLFALLYRYEKPRPSIFIGLGIGILGFSLLAYSVTGGLTALSFKGVLAIVAAALANGWGAMLTRPYIVSYGAKRVASLQMLAGGFILLLLSLGLEHPSMASLAALSHSKTLFSLLYLVAIGSVLGFTLYQHLLATWQLSSLASYNFVSPVISLMLGFMFLAERFETAELAAILLLLLATFFMARRRR
jgi:drug/metabolite transporter (DMT)-like permease